MLSRTSFKMPNMTEPRKSMMCWLVRFDEPVTIDQVYESQDEWEREKVRDLIAWLWWRNFVVASDGGYDERTHNYRPMLFEATEAGKLVAKMIIEGVEINKQVEELDKLRAAHPNNAVLDDRHAVQRKLFVAYEDGEPVLAKSRWIYSTGASRRPDPEEFISYTRETT